jgi:hypothetical protein
MRAVFVLAVLAVAAGAQVLPAAGVQGGAAPQGSQSGQAGPAFDEWGDTFDGKELDAARWERFSFEGGGLSSLKVEDGHLAMRGTSGSRAGVWSKQEFDSDQAIVEAAIVKVGQGYPEPGSGRLAFGNAIVTLMFDGSGRNRVEWLLTSEGTFEAWAMVDGRTQRLDSSNLGTKIKNPTLSIARKGDDFYFALNGQVGLQKNVRGLPRAFRVMLYGLGTSECVWDSVRVLTVKQQAAPGK